MQSNIKKKIKKKIKINPKKGIVFWVTGLSGVGKTTISKSVHKKLEKEYGPTIFFNGDDIRKIFKLKNYNKNSRKKYAFFYSNMCKFITNQKINVLIAVVGLFDDVREWNRLNFINYVEIFIKANKRNIKKKDTRKIYSQKNVFGKDIKPELPKKPNIIIVNDFKKFPLNIGNKLIFNIKNTLVIKKNKK